MIRHAIVLVLLACAPASAQELTGRPDLDKANDICLRHHTDVTAPAGSSITIHRVWGDGWGSCELIHKVWIDTIQDNRRVEREKAEEAQREKDAPDLAFVNAYANRLKP